MLVTDELGGNKAAYELGAEYEMHLISPAISDETNENLGLPSPRWFRRRFTSIIRCVNRLPSPRWFRSVSVGCNST